LITSSPTSVDETGVVPKRIAEWKSPSSSESGSVASIRGETMSPVL